MPDQPIPYRDDLETPLDDEQAIIDETIATMSHTMAGGFEQHRHGTSGTHAKSHGVVTGSLTVAEGLPPELAQGMFATPATYDVVLRLASEPGTIDPDTAKRARGAALKILDVPGEKLEQDWTSQDFLFNTWPVIPQGDAKTYLDVIKQRDEHAGHHLRAGTAAVHPTLKETIFDRTPNRHPVAFTYYSQAAFRYGDYVAKFSLAPNSQAQQDVYDRTVSSNDPPGVLSEWVSQYFAEHEAVFDFRVQLPINPDTMPVEDAAAEWPEDESPYRTVATITLPKQDSFAAARRVYAEDVMSWRPWNGLVAFRPLGSLNRLRRRAYSELGKQRHDTNAAPEENPRTLSEVP